MSTNQTIKPKPTTREYVENYQQTDMAKTELARYCLGCGRLPCWCECVIEIHDEDRERRLANGTATAQDIACGGNPMLALKRYMPCR